MDYERLGRFLKKKRKEKKKDGLRMGRVRQ